MRQRITPLKKTMENIWHPASRYCSSFRSFSSHTTLWYSTLWGSLIRLPNSFPHHLIPTYHSQCCYLKKGLHFGKCILPYATMSLKTIKHSVFSALHRWGGGDSQRVLKWLNQGDQVTQVTSPALRLQCSDTKAGYFPPIKAGEADMMDTRTSPFIFSIILITEEVLSGQRKCLNSWATRPAAAATPELVSPRPIPPRTPSQRLQTSLYVVWGQDKHGGAVWAPRADWAGQGGRRAVFSVGKGKIWTSKRSGAHLFRLEEVEFFCTFELFSQGRPLPPTQETSTETGLFQWGLRSPRATRAKQERGSGARREDWGAGRSWERRGETERAVKMSKDGWRRREQRERKGKAGKSDIETFWTRIKGQMAEWNWAGTSQRLTPN